MITVKTMDDDGFIVKRTFAEGEEEEVEDKKDKKDEKKKNNKDNKDNKDEKKEKKAVIDPTSHFEDLNPYAAALREGSYASISEVQNKKIWPKAKVTFRNLLLQPNLSREKSLLLNLLKNRTPQKKKPLRLHLKK